MRGRSAFKGMRKWDVKKRRSAEKPNLYIDNSNAGTTICSMLNGSGEAFRAVEAMPMRQRHDVNRNITHVLGTGTRSAPPRRDGPHTISGLPLSRMNSVAL